MVAVIGGPVLAAYRVLADTFLIEVGKLGHDVVAAVATDIGRDPVVDGGGVSEVQRYEREVVVLIAPS